jgi:hypothetical protein
MMKYRKRPVVVEAEQWFPGDKVEGVEEALKAPDGTLHPMSKPFETGEYTLVAAIQTLEGWHEVSPGDYIITGVKGEKYPCKPDIFEATYELAGNANLPEDRRKYIQVQFQNGPIQEFGANGCQVEDVIQVCIDRLRGFQKGPFPCVENAAAIASLEEALATLNERTRKRRAQGVEGMNVKHQS